MKTPWPHLFITGLLSILLLQGCDKTQDSVENSDNKGVIPQHQLDALDKANEVEGLLKDTDKTRRESMEDG